MQPDCKNKHTAKPLVSLPQQCQSEMAMVVMKNRRHQSSKDTHQPNDSFKIPIPSTICPAWKLYENPFYISHHKTQIPNHQQQDWSDQKQLHRLHLPISARKIATSFWDLTFIKPFMESESQMARAQIADLKAELESERRARRKAESFNKRLAREVSEEIKQRKALESVCHELANEISSHKMEMIRIKKEMDEERRMLRTAEVIREERVQMKLGAAKRLLEQTYSELEIARKNVDEIKQRSCSVEAGHVVGSSSSSSMGLMRRNVFVEAENPHIKRGIKGFVEFPRVIRRIGCSHGKHMSRKFECQKAQLKILINQKSKEGINGLVKG